MEDVGGSRGGGGKLISSSEVGVRFPGDRGSESYSESARRAEEEDGGGGGGGG